MEEGLGRRMSSRTRKVPSRMVPSSDHPTQNCEVVARQSRNKTAGKRKRTSKRAVSGWQIKKHKVERSDIQDWAGKGKRTPRRAVGSERKDFRDWAGLLDYLLEEVIRRLPVVDCLSFSSVCKPWKSVATKYLGGCDRRVPCFVKRGENNSTVRSGFNFLKNSNFKMELPQAHGRMIFGSFQDWLFLGRREKTHLDISLLNPFSGENIMLPKTHTQSYLMVLSAVPSDKSCVCMLIDDLWLSFWTPGAQKWRVVNQWRSFEILDALYYNGCFYLLHKDGQVFVIKVDDVINTDKRATVPYQTFSLELPDFRFSDGCSRYYLVESRGDILLVSRFFMTNIKTLALEAYKLDFHKIAWLKLENLEDRILFVGSGCSRSFHANDLGHALANNVYFINDPHCVPMNEWHLSYMLDPCHKNDNMYLIDDPYKSYFSFTRNKYYKNDSDDWGVYFRKKSDQWPSAFQVRAKRWAGVWLTAPLSWCLKHGCR